METIQIPRNQKEIGITYPNSGIINIDSWVLKNPILVLLILWTAYLVLDLFTTFLLGIKITDWKTPSYNYLVSFLIVFVYFKILTSPFKLAQIFLINLALVPSMILLFIYAKYLFSLYPSGEFSNLFHLAVIETLRIIQFLGVTTAFVILFQKSQTKINYQKLLLNHFNLKLSPHFTLNNFTLLASQISRSNPKFFLEFLEMTNLLRYSFKDPTQPNFLKEEIMAVNQYLYFQKKRFPKSNIQTLIDIPDNVLSYPFSKLCLLTFIENIFNHGNYTDLKQPCYIIITAKQNGDFFQLIFSIYNKIAAEKDLPHTGTGSETAFQILTHDFGKNLFFCQNKSEEDFSLLMVIQFGNKYQ